jgi:NNP family nitrate/nitrite transporter-like MFS transporter
MTGLYLFMYFPMWGGLFSGPKEGVTEEDYYLAEVSNSHPRGFP